MTLKEEMKKALGLIEELNPESEYLTDDPDIKAKIYDVFNQVMFELARVKKIPRYVEIDVSGGDLITFDTIGEACGSTVYQLSNISGISYELKAQGTVIKALEEGTLEVDLYIYPERITEKTKPNAYEFELSEDALEIMPYGVAADLLKSDVSSEYGSVYAKRYNDMLQRLDPRYSLPCIVIEGGVDI